jgi:hypothetical protein
MPTAASPFGASTPGVQHRRRRRPSPLWAVVGVVAADGGSPAGDVAPATLIDHRRHNLHDVVHFTRTQRAGAGWNPQAAIDGNQAHVAPCLFRHPRRKRILDRFCSWLGVRSRFLDSSRPFAGAF